MIFRIDYNEFNDYGTPIYRKSEQSFDFEPWGNSDFSLMLGSSCIGLEINLNNKRLLYLSGLSPIKTWKKDKVVLPNFKKGALFIENSEDYAPGTGIETNNQFTAFYDKKTGWICFHSERLPEYDNCIMFANNTIAALSNNVIVSIWIKPKFI